MVTKRGLTTSQQRKSNKHQSNNILQQKEEELSPLSGEELQVIVSTKRTGIKDCNTTSSATSTTTTTSHVTIKEEVLQSSFCSQSTSATATTTTMHDDDDDTGSMNDDGNNCKEEEEEEMSYIRILPPPQKDSVAKLVFQYCSKNDEDTSYNVPTSSSTSTGSCNMMTKCYMVPIPSDIKDGDEFYVKAGTTRVQLICPQSRSSSSNISRYNKSYYNTMVFELVPCTCKDCTATSTLSHKHYKNEKKQHERQRRHHHRHRQQHYPTLCHLRVVNDTQFLKFYHDIENIDHVETLCWTKGWNSFTNIHIKQIQNVLLKNKSSNNKKEKNEYNSNINEICIANVPKQYQSIIIDYIMHLITMMKSHNTKNNSSMTSNNNHRHTINITIQDTKTDFQTIDNVPLQVYPIVLKNHSH